MNRPAAGVDACAFRKTVAPGSGLSVGENENDPPGGVDVVTLTVWLALDDAPRSFVTVNVATKAPALMYECRTRTPEAVSPSPKFHAYDTICDAFVPGVLADASNNESMFNVTGVGAIVKVAVGASAGGRMTPVGTRRISAL